jgi:hypothetical protein
MISPKTGALALIILVLVYAIVLAICLSSCQIGRVVEGFRQFDTNKPPAHAKP